MIERERKATLDASMFNGYERVENRKERWEKGERNSVTAPHVGEAPNRREKE